MNCIDCGVEVIDGKSGHIQHMEEENHTEYFCNDCDTIQKENLYTMEDASSCLKHKEFQDPFGGCSSCYKEWENEAWQAAHEWDVERNK